MSTAENIPIKTKDQIRDDMLATYREGLIAAGIANPVTTKGTEIYNRFEADAQQIFVAAANIPAAVDESLEDTALLNLERLAAMRELSLRAAGGSRGDVFPVVVIAGPVLIPAGSTLIDGQGLRYRATLGGPIENGDPLTVEALDTGAATNRAPDTTVTFESPPLYVEPKALVGPGGMRFGVDAEDLEGLRERTLERMRHPRNGVNWSTFTAAAEQSTAVQKGFAYQACNGPSTVHVAVVGSPTAEVKNRDVDAITMTVEVAPQVAGVTFSFVEVVTTTVVLPVVEHRQFFTAITHVAGEPQHGGLLVVGVEETGLVLPCIGFGEVVVVAVGHGCSLARDRSRTATSHADDIPRGAETPRVPLGEHPRRQDVRLCRKGALRICQHAKGHGHDAVRSPLLVSSGRSERKPSVDPVPTRAMSHLGSDRASGRAFRGC
jgi:uncharacterized phage protein gp47/JayE